MSKNIFSFGRKARKAVTLHRHLIKKAPWRGGEKKETLLVIKVKGLKL